MANEQSIEEIISGQAFEQLDKLKKDLADSNKLFIDNVASVNQLNAAIGKSKTFREFNKSADAAALAVERLNKAQLASQAQAEKLADIQAKNAFAEEKRTNARIAQEAKRTAELDKQTAKVIANAEKEVAAMEKAEAKKEAAIAKLAVIQEKEDAKRAAALEKQAAIDLAIQEKAEANKAKISNSQAEADAYNNTANGSAKVTSALNEQDIAQGKVASSAAATTLASEENTAASNKNSLSKKQQILLAAQEKANNQANALALKNQAKELNAAKGSLDQRSAALARLQKVFGSLNEQERASPFGQRLAKTIPQLNDQVLELEKNIGKSQRNVGNYTSAFDKVAGGAKKAFSALRFVANILPGIGVAGILGFATEPIIEYISQLDAFKEKTTDIIQSTAFKSSNFTEAVSQVSKLKTSIDEFNQGTISGKTLVDRYNESIGQTAGILKTTQEVEDFYNSKSKDYIQAMFLRAQANAALQISTDKLIEAQLRAASPSIADKIFGGLSQFRKIISRSLEGDVTGTSTLGDFASAVLAEQADGVKDLNKQAKDSLTLFDTLQKQADAYAKAHGLNLEDNKKGTKAKVDTSELDAQKARLEAERNTQKAIVDNEKASFEERTGALENYVSIVKQLNAVEAATAIKQGKNVSAERAKQATADKKVAIEAGQELVKITEFTEKQRIDLLTQVEKDEIQGFKDVTNAQLEEIELRRAQQSQATAEQYADGKITRKRYLSELDRIDNEAATESIKVQIDAQQKIIDADKLYLSEGIGTNKQLGEDEKKLAELRIRLSKLGTDAKLAELEKIERAHRQTKDALIQLGQEVFDFGKTLGDASFQRRLDQLDAESKASSDKKDQDIENVEDSVASEDQKQQQIAIINKRADNEQKIIEARQAEVKQRQARFNKAISIAEIATNTAVAIMKTYSEFGFPLGLPLAITQAAIGAVQAAVVLATPIPKYKDGVKSAPGGLAWVGDGFENELRIEPNGSVSMTPDVPTLTNLKPGTQIIGGAELKRMAKTGDYSNINADMKPVLKELKTLNRSIGGQKQYRTILTEKGLHNSAKSATGITKYLNRNFGN